MVCFKLWAVPSLLHTQLIPSFQNKLIFASPAHRMVLQNCTLLLDFLFFLQTLIWPSWLLRLTNCSHFWRQTVYSYSGEIVFRLWTLTQITLPPGACFWSGQMLWRSFSVAFRYFFVCQQVLSFQEHTKQLFLFILWWVCFDIFSLMMTCFTGSDNTLDYILRVNSNIFQCHTLDQLQTFYLGTWVK